MTSTLEALYNEGTKQQEGKSKKVTKAKTKGTGKVTAEKGVENTPIHKLAEAIASKTGLDFEIRDGSILVTDAAQNALTDADGNEIYSNGQFRADISKVVLGVNDKAYQTLAHEAIGEFLEAYNPEDMQEIQDTILTYLLETSRLSKNSVCKIRFTILDENSSIDGVDVRASRTESGGFSAKVGAEDCVREVFGQSARGMSMLMIQ